MFERFFDRGNVAVITGFPCPDVLIVRIPPNFRRCAVVSAQPWLKRENESAHHFAMLQRYLEWPRGTRSIQNLAQSFRVQFATVAEVAERHEWKARVAAYDRHIDSIYDDERDRLVREEAERSLRTVVDAQRVAAAELQKLLIAARENEPALMKPRDVSKLLDLSVRLGLMLRESFRALRERNAGEDALDLSLLDDDEMALFSALAAKATRSDPR